MIACILISLPAENQKPTAYIERLGRDVTILLVARTPALERAGLLGWFVDLNGCERLLRNDFPGWGLQMTGLIRNRFGVETRVGVGSNKVMAGIACRLADNGTVLWLLPGNEPELVARASLQILPRLTPQHRQLLSDRRRQWASEIKELGEDCLRQWLGNRDGGEAWKVIHGQCDDPVKPYRVPRVIQKTHLFPLVTTSQQDMIRAGIYLVGALYHEVHKLGGTLRKVSCRLVYVDGLEASREIHLGELHREEEYAAATARMLEHLPLRRVQLRLLQLRCPVDFEPAEQQDLFSERDRLKRRDLDQALKDVREKYGVEALHRASGTACRRTAARRAP